MEASQWTEYGDDVWKYEAKTPEKIEINPKAMQEAQAPAVPAEGQRSKKKPKTKRVKFAQRGCEDLGCRCEAWPMLSPESPDKLSLAELGKAPIKPKAQLHLGAVRAEEPATAEGNVLEAAPRPDDSRPSGSTLERAPSTDEIARASDKHEDATRPGSNSKPVALFELGGNRSLNEIKQREWLPMPGPLVVDSGPARQCYRGPGLWHILWNGRQARSQRISIPLPRARLFTMKGEKRL